MENSLDVVADVLLVDDDVSSSAALAAVLQNQGYSVISAVNGRDALNYLRSFPGPGIILLDLMMPVMGGREFLEHQSRDPTLSDIPVLILTATPQDDPLSAKAILVKPIRPKELFRMIERFRRQE